MSSVDNLVVSLTIDQTSELGELLKLLRDVKEAGREAKGGLKQGIGAPGAKVDLSEVLRRFDIINDKIMALTGPSFHPSINPFKAAQLLKEIVGGGTMKEAAEKLMGVLTEGRGGIKAYASRYGFKEFEGREEEVKERLLTDIKIAILRPLSDIMMGLGTSNNQAKILSAVQMLISENVGERKTAFSKLLNIVSESSLLQKPLEKLLGEEAVGELTYNRLRVEELAGKMGEDIKKKLEGIDLKDILEEDKEKFEKAYDDIKLEGTNILEKFARFSKKLGEEVNIAKWTSEGYSDLKNKPYFKYFFKNFMIDLIDKVTSTTNIKDIEKSDLFNIHGAFFKALTDLTDIPSKKLFLLIGKHTDIVTTTENLLNKIDNLISPEKFEEITKELHDNLVAFVELKNNLKELQNEVEKRNELGIPIITIGAGGKATSNIPTTLISLPKLEEKVGTPLKVDLEQIKKTIKDNMTEQTNTLEGIRKKISEIIGTNPSDTRIASILDIVKSIDNKVNPVKKKVSQEEVPTKKQGEIE